MLLMMTTTANIGNSLLIKIPSNCAKNPNPILAPSAPNNGKQDAQPIAATMAPTEPTLSVKLNIFMAHFSILLKSARQHWPDGFRVSQAHKCNFVCLMTKSFIVDAVPLLSAS